MEENQKFSYTPERILEHICREGTPFTVKDHGPRDHKEGFVRVPMNKVRDMMLQVQTRIGYISYLLKAYYPKDEIGPVGPGPFAEKYWEESKEPDDFANGLNRVLKQISLLMDDVVRITCWFGNCITVSILNKWIKNAVKYPSSLFNGLGHLKYTDIKGNGRPLKRYKQTQLTLNGERPGFIAVPNQPFIDFGRDQEPIQVVTDTKSYRQMYIHLEEGWNEEMGVYHIPVCFSCPNGPLIDLDFEEDDPMTFNGAFKDCVRSYRLTRPFRFDIEKSHEEEEVLFFHKMRGRLADIGTLFAKQRNWDGNYKPRNLVFALMGEIGELAALLQWKPDESFEANPRVREKIADETADVCIYALRFCKAMGVEME